jgi:hypothetical protein
VASAISLSLAAATTRKDRSRSGRLCFGHSLNDSRRMLFEINLSKRRG